MNGEAILCGCGRRMKPDRRAQAPGRYRCGCGAAIQLMGLIEGRCVAPKRFGAICNQDAVITRPIALCPDHLTDMLEQPNVYIHETAHRIIRNATERDALKRAERERRNRLYVRLEKERREQLRRQAVVYYIRRDTRIKIGTTTNMHQRMIELQPDEILATEPGSRPLERRRHQQFAHIRYRGEWFTPADDLLEHIARVRAEHGEPARTTYVPMGAAS